MKNYKRVLSLLLSLVITTSAVSPVAFASGTPNDAVDAYLKEVLPRYLATEHAGGF